MKKLELEIPPRTPAADDAARGSAETGAPVGDDVCPHCGGTGWIQEPDDGVGSARRCPAHGQGYVQRLLDAAGIPERYRRCRLARFETVETDAGRQAELQQALTVCRRYVDGFALGEEGFRETGLLFTGPPGTGKTHLAVAVLVDLIERYRVSGRFVELTSLVHDLQSTFDAGSTRTKGDVLEPLLTTRVLVIDELGAQKLTPWVQDVLYLLINTRYTRRLATLFTTNFRLERGAEPQRKVNLDSPRDTEPDRFAAERYGLLSHRLPPMLISRLYEMALPVSLHAVHDYRQEVRVHQTRV